MITLQIYRQKYSKWKSQRNPSVDFKTDADVAYYTIMLKNLP